MKKMIGISSIFAALAISSGAFAQGNSTPGIDRYENNPGRQQATEVGAQCGSGAGSGGVGFFAKDKNLGLKSDPTDPGADDHQAGVDNSSICGNRQGNLP